MGDGFSVDANGLMKIVARFDSPAVKKAILDIPKAKAIAALIGQAIADNFDKEGPGWKPLKGVTLRLSVIAGLRKHAERQAARAMGLLKLAKSGKTSVNRKGLNKGSQFSRVSEFNERVEEILVKGEAHARKVGAEPGRMILQKTGTLKKVSTIPMKTAVNKNGATGKNTYHVEGTTVFWGTDLSYARVHNRGGFAGRGKKVKIPQREFLVIRKPWMQEIEDYMVQQILNIIRKSLLRGE